MRSNHRKVVIAAIKSGKQSPIISRVYSAGSVLFTGDAQRSKEIQVDGKIKIFSLVPDNDLRLI
jgi:hypothetical protein